MQNRSANIGVSAEESLVARARRKDQAAVRIIIGQNNRRLFRLARSILGNDSEAEDIVQETYFRAFTQLDQFRGDSNLSTWLTRILINESYGRLRRRRLTVDWESMEQQAMEEAQIIPFPSALQSDPEHSMAKNQILAILEGAIDALPEAFRVVLVARLIEEMSVEQTAEALALRPETVKTRLHRARNLLREHLESKIGPLLTDVFPFAGERCERIADVVIARLGADSEPGGTNPHAADE